FQYVSHVGNTFVRDLRNVKQTVSTWQDVHERTEFNDTNYFTCVDRTWFNFSSQRLDFCNRSLCSSFSFTKYAYCTVIFDVNRSFSFFSDLTNRCTTFTNHVTDLVRVDVDHLESRRVHRNFWTST